jgi:hypothetical protein
MDIGRIEDIWSRLLAGGELSAAEREELLDAMSADRELRTRFLRDEQIDGQLRTLGRCDADQDEFATQSMDRLSAERKGDAFIRRMKGTMRDAGVFRRPARLRIVRWRTWAIAAACVLTVAGTVFYNLHRTGRLPEVIGRVTLADSDVRIERQGETIIACVGTVIRIGDTLVTQVESSAEVAYDDGGAEVTFGDNTRAVFLGEERGRRLKVLEGSLQARVDPEAKSPGLTVGTPDAEIRVKGTEFMVTVQESSTYVDVTSGFVGVVRCSDREEELVGPGQNIRVEKDRPFVVGVSGRRLRLATKFHGLIRGMAARPGEIWLSHRGPGKLTVWDSGSGALVRQVDVSHITKDPGALAWDGNRLWMVGSDLQVHAIDEEGELLRTIELEEDVKDICVGGGYLLGCVTPRQILKIDLELGEAVDVLTVARGALPWLFGIGYHDGTPWILSNHGFMFRIDPMDGAALSVHRLQRGLLLSFDGKNALAISSPGAIGRVWMFDASLLEPANLP